MCHAASYTMHAGLFVPALGKEVENDIALGNWWASSSHLLPQCLHQMRLCQLLLVVSCHPDCSCVCASRRQNVMAAVYPNSDGSCNLGCLQISSDLDDIHTCPTYMQAAQQALLGFAASVLAVPVVCL
jgi:hypothetical protein